MKEQIEEMRKDLIEIFDEEYEKRRLVTPQNTAEKMTAKGYRKQEWISVEDRLPTRPGAYLVFTIDRRISMCHFIDHYCDGDMQFDDYRVTNWMPLPEPPKMKGGE